MTNKLFSFDIFDTCIVRSCGRPDNIYFLLAEAVLKDKTESMIHAFVKARKVAEKKAEKELKKEAVAIDEIYKFFDTSIFSDLSSIEIKNKEIEIDLHSLVPVYSMIHLLNECRKKGRVIFISDMYLPDSALKNTLRQIGVINDDETIYISGTIGLSKRTGHLFDYVKEKERVNVKDWTHYGDHPIGDGKSPKSRGIKVIPVNHQYSPIEHTWDKEAQTFGRIPVSLFAGAVKSVRNHFYYGGSDEFVPDVMAALFVPFVLSVLNDAKKRNIQRLYFAARDGYILYKIAQIYGKDYPTIELRYLHISTKVLYPLMITEGTKEEVDRLLGMLPGFKPEAVLDMLGYDKDEKLDISNVIDLEQPILETNNLVDGMARKMVCGKRGENLKRRCMDKRLLLIDYLNQEKFLSSGRVGLVDIGWRCSSQSILRNLGKDDIIFYYLGVSPYRLPIEKTGSFISYMYGDDIDCSYYTLLIEFYMCRTLDGTTVGYQRKEGIIEPILSKEKGEPSVANEIRENEYLVLEVAKACGKYLSIKENAEFILKTCSIRTMIEFCEHPTSHLVEKIAPSLNYLHFGFKKPVIEKIYPWTYLKYKISHALSTPKYNKFWLYGSLVYTYGKWGEKLVYALNMKK